jgi:paired amphipathic helix protein Sin3a
VLYSRLLPFKGIAAKIALDGPTRSKSTARSLGLPSRADLAQFSDREPTAEHYYELFLESCERLFDNEIEQHAFEDQMRLMFGTKVKVSSCEGYAPLLTSDHSGGFQVFYY